jgi:hypothetical protein
MIALWAFVYVGTEARPAAQMVNTGTGSTRPYRTLFGGAAPGPTGNQSLIFNGAVFAGYDDDIFARGSGGPSSGGPNQPRVAGQFVGSQLSLNYQRRYATSTLGATAATANRYVTDSKDFVNTFAAGSVSFQGQPRPRTSYALQQSFSYRPYYTPALFPPTSTVGPSLEGETAPPFPDEVGGVPDDFTVASDRDGVRAVTLAQLQHRLSPRSSVQLRGQYGLTDFGAPDLDSVDNDRWGAAATYSYDMTRYLSARLGYGYRTYNTSAEDVGGNHDINIGVLFNRPFTIGSGRTVFSFTTGSTILRRERVAGSSESDGRFVARAIGTANLAHAFSATWQGNLSYAHTVGYQDGFTEPIEGDRFGASLGGLLTPSLDLAVSAGYVSGAVGLSERNFDSTLANARLRFALHPRAALFAQYFCYTYLYKDGVADHLLASPELERQGFRAGLNIWLPLVR